MAGEPADAAATLSDTPASPAGSAESGGVAAVALKEWAEVCAALGAGEQTVRTHALRCRSRTTPICSIARSPGRVPLSHGGSLTRAQNFRQAAVLHSSGLH